MSEVRALLITDVVGSTELTERIGDEAVARLWEAHDRCARDLLPAHSGREIDKTDGMLLMFEQAADAVAYAAAYHQALQRLSPPLQARAGLHVGPVVLRENLPEDVARGAKPLEVDGLAKPIAARVVSVAGGGQTLLTPEAMAALGALGALGAAWHTASHGHWLLKGVSEPVELFEIGREGQPMPCPPDAEKAWRVVQVQGQWRPVREIANNLPLQATSFIGRERERAELRALMSKSRLVTLLGMGGLGKTRLSLQVAGELMAQFPDGVWFIDLAPIRDAALVVGELAQVLGVREEPGRALLQTVCAHLRSQRALLVVDNCEQVVAACATMVAAVMKAAPEVRLITSSREALHVPGEQAYPILPLPVPQRGDSVEQLASLTAVRLFVERAQQHKPAFTLSEREAPAVAELVARLEGIPLALELAAARVRSLSVADINLRLNDRYRLLTGGSRVLQERQQTLRALVDWSYDILDEREQRLLQRLSVFRGGFDLEAAEPVCSTEPIDALDVLDLLASLVEKSLVMTDERSEPPRYRMLETIADYAREKLEQAGQGSDTAQRHCEHYFALAKQVNRGLQGPEQAQWVARMETELDNTRAALATALAGGADAFIAVKIAVAMQGFWTLRGYLSEGRTAVNAALALPAVQASPMAQAHALYVGAALAASQSDYAEAERMLATCLALRRELGAEAEIAATLSTLALARFGRGDAHGALAGEQEALALFKRQGHAVGEAVALLHLGQFHTRLRNAEAARQHLQDGLALARRIRHQEVEAECELVLGQLALQQGQALEAAQRFARSQAVCEGSGDRQGEASAHWWQGRLALRAGAWGEAQPALAQALQAFIAAGRRLEALLCLHDLAQGLSLHGANAPTALRVMAASEGGLALIAAALPEDEAQDRRRAQEALRRRWADDGAFTALWTEAQDLGLEAAARLALAAPAGAALTPALSPA